MFGSNRVPKKVEDPDVSPLTSASLLHSCVIPLEAPSLVPDTLGASLWGEVGLQP